MSLRGAAVAATAAAALAAVSVPAGAVGVRITALRVVRADTRTPVAPPYRRDVAYAYLVTYRITGAGTLTVSRRAVVRTAGGALIARIAPPAAHGRAGDYFASARIPVGPADPATTYTLSYRVTVRGAHRATAAAARALRLVFR
ncbi:MAG: hypothetical protein U0Y82_14885 [Thermoleophilia bacterium]